LIFLAVDITNHSCATFTYTASFDKSAGTLFSFPGVLNREPRNAFLSPHETTVFILAIEKAELLASASAVPPKRVMAAVKLEEEILKHKVDKTRRAVLVERLGITTFLESHLTFEWRVGDSRRGTLTTENSALPTPETLVELRLHRPRARHSFAGFDGNCVRCEERIRLRVAYDDALVVRCALVLGLYIDPDYGVAWDGTLDGRPLEENAFEFVLFFTKAGKFDVRVEYETAEGVTGGHRISILARETV
jgi:hypothetical protein